MMKIENHPSPKKPPESARASIRRHLLTGVLIVFLLGGGVGGWAATTELAGALIAQGSIVVDSNVKKVQHPTGGIVGQLFVRDGDHVKAGEMLVRLDETVMRANLAIVTKGLDQLTARKARLEAERDGVPPSPSRPAACARRSRGQQAVNSERKLFDLRRNARLGQKAQLNQRIDQLEQEISGIEAQQAAKTQEIKLIHNELSGVRALYAKNLVQINV